MKRRPWSEYFMDIAIMVSNRSTCDRATVGAIIVKDKHILSTGYNGAPSGKEHCGKVGHLLVDGHCIRAIHAETNAIGQCSLLGHTSTKNCVCYTTHTPCINCAKLLYAAGIEIIFAKFIRDDEDYLLTLFESKKVSQTGLFIYERELRLE